MRNHRRCATIGSRERSSSLAELNGEFGLDVVPTNHYAANSAWQQLSVLAHNLFRGFQRDTGARPKRRSRKRTYAYLLRSMRTVRFLVIARAGRLTRVTVPEDQDQRGQGMPSVAPHVGWGASIRRGSPFLTM